MPKQTGIRAPGPSITDVAREAGVATSTVSRALTIPGRVAEPTRLKVEAAARKLGYTANQTARNLRVGVPRTIMIVLPDEIYIGASQTVSEVLRATAEGLTDRGFSLLIANVSRAADTDAHILSVAQGGTVSGVLLMASDMPKAEGRSLADTGLPIVSLHFDLSGEGVPSVVSNDHDAIAEATRALVALGHRRFLYIRGTLGNYHERERLAGVRDALAQSGLQEGALHLSQGDFNFSGGIAAAKDFLALPADERPTAVVCANDDMAIGFMRSVVDEGVRIPEDVSVIGFDGAAVAPFLTPALATIQQDTPGLGRRAATILMDMVLGEQLHNEQRFVVPATLVLRESVGPLL
ncbi:LacI family DNA-binding transcriptional regulator [Kaistia dalseonensis]|uniref:LacI family repressor for deo operon, udp, cdd, tsx, nupC, and nupG n=1 Tax=Kaistia dalseonensis TaxID=410840 RepID=A0ABU0H6V9_9HYPH|nr:LacI family DNA-binding transcriptional regulator [Kaistia dalseonensis]MCX5495460.1 LacI family DNA-binding transcriptional regulator [Kaistia dalseonensis]MDQ0438051.1 LacI family repressor for deo operon, udp, cdd, tsx, nupC, and nupG [Kaistia dalseonensis]